LNSERKTVEGPLNLAGAMVTTLGEAGVTKEERLPGTEGFRLTRWYDEDGTFPLVSVHVRIGMYVDRLWVAGERWSSTNSESPSVQCCFEGRCSVWSNAPVVTSSVRPAEAAQHERT
jgi:hypothetical protein